MSRLVSSLLMLVFLVAAGLSQERAPAPTELSEDSVQALLIRKVAPVYPPLARQARIQGTVILKIVISKDGDVRDVQLYSGHPMLAPAAIAAVKKWKYQPYTKDVEAVEVSTMVRVNFNMPDSPAPTGTVGAGPIIATPELRSALGVERVSEAVMRPLRVQKIDPTYPETAIERRIQGTVTLELRIDSSGSVESVLLVSGHPTLAPSAIEAVKQWKYSPYFKDGKSTSVDSVVRLTFSLAGDEAGAVTEPEPLGSEFMPRLATPTRVRVSSGVIQGLLITKVAPEYPEEARQAGIQGTVILQVRIDKEGNVVSLESVSGHPMLAPAAIEAVRQWKYRPYLLNGEAVEVETQVRVNFALQ